MSEQILHTSELRQAIPFLKTGERVLLSGTIYTARDAAHKRLFSLLDAGEPLPFPLQDTLIYYAGPTPAQIGMAVGSCGPTTSSRMDPYTPRLLELGLVGMIGKGERSEAVCEAIVNANAVYFCAVGGAGALIANAIKSVQQVAFEELGCESIKRMQIQNFPLIVAIDAHGGNIFKEGRIAYQTLP